MTISEIQKQYRDALVQIYDEREARSVTQLVFEKVLELQSHKLFLEKIRLLTVDQKERLEQILKRLLTYEPPQYILGEADFYGLKFKVNSSVLIPRPETEELVAWVKSSISNNQSSILDIGTGSGCIAVALSKEFPDAQITATDKSSEALNIASENNSLLKTNVSFLEHDILTTQLDLQRYDVIVSNPPYIGVTEAATMSDNVLKYEPHLALFATDGDDLIFYRKIASEASTALKPGGMLFFEINRLKGPEVVDILKKSGFKNVELRKDLSGDDRMVKGIK